MISLNCKFKIAKMNSESKVIVFMGDSITEFWKVKSNFFSNNPSYSNKGISGQTTAQMLPRFQKDVVDMQPSTVVILAGINDIAENTGPITLEAIMDNIIVMTEMAKTNAIDVILCSVLPANHFNWNHKIEPAGKVIALNDTIKRYAAANKIPFVDYYQAMVDEDKGLCLEYGDDAVHPSSKGYEIMEAILLPFLK
jgi:lysophospholipase L1-like esterase